MENIVEILPNCYIIYTQAGFRKLLKKLHCYGKNADNSYYVGQYTDDKNAFFQKSYPQYDNKTGKPLFDENGERVINTYDCHVQYPIKYPCIITYEDYTFETSQISFYIRYISSHINTDNSIVLWFDKSKLKDEFNNKAKDE